MGTCGTKVMERVMFYADLWRGRGGMNDNDSNTNVITWRRRILVEGL